jgi:hypothetical protein
MSSDEMEGGTLTKAGVYDCQLPVLVESIHVVNDEKGIITDIRPVIVRLQFVDESSHV